MHLVWADTQWMSRFDGWPKPEVGLKQSAGMVDDFAALQARRETGDAAIIDWSRRVDDAWLAEDLVWFSGAANRDMRAPKGPLVVHFFNHQTHHRGQAHALLTAGGQDTGDTDLFLVVPTRVKSAAIAGLLQTALLKFVAAATGAGVVAADMTEWIWDRLRNVAGGGAGRFARSAARRSSSRAASEKPYSVERTPIASSKGRRPSRTKSSANSASLVKR